MMIRFSTIACVALVAGFGITADAFTVPGSTFKPNKISALYMQQENDPVSGDSNSLENLPIAAAVSTAMWSVLPNMSMAAGPDWGLFEGKTGSLLHPMAMAGLLFYSLYTGYLGLQFRRQRELGNEISDLRKLLPKVEAASIADALQQEDLAPSDKIALQKGLEVESQINELAAERKELSSKGLRDQHFNQGALLAFIGTFFAIEGPLNTYARAGKLFPGPHLYAGAGLVVLWAAAAACVPAMQKGSDTARSIHIGANAIGTGLFFWQVVSGLPILFKVWEKTQWP